MDLKRASLQMERSKELTWMELKPLHIQTGKLSPTYQHIYHNNSDSYLYEILTNFYQKLIKKLFKNKNKIS